MKTTVRLLLECSGVAVRKSLTSVLKPDNEGAPRGLEISMDAEGRRIRFRVESESPTTTISTALAILRDVSLFQEVWLLSQRKDAPAYRA